MIESLQISNYALIDSIEIEFGSGLNVITGETGAGKSIILGALSQILGGRADSRVVTSPERKSVVEAVFTADSAVVDKFLRDNDIDIPADDSLPEGLSRVILRRELSPSGRSRAFINDTPVAVSKLRDIAIHLVDIHSQHQNLLLATPQFQLDIIDSLAGNAELLREYQALYHTLRDDMRRLKRTRAAVAQAREDEDFLRYQLEGLDKLNLVAGEEDDLEREMQTLSNLSEIKASVNTAIAALGTDEAGAIDTVTAASAACAELEAAMEPGAAEQLSSRLETVAIELRDILDTLQSFDSDLVADPAALSQIEARIDEIRQAKARYKVESVAELTARRDDIARRIDLLESGTERLADLERRARRSLSLAREAASRLTDSRKAQAEAFAEALRQRALPLGMRNLQVDIHLAPADLSASGADAIEFLFAFNKNQPLQPVGLTASGGEISRLMLSIKAIIAEHMSLPSVIFDEIDTGVSGDVAQRMGALMLDISRFSQVIAITHLPQVASKGSAHFRVYKEDDEDATHTHIRRLAPAERIDEIATMLSGDASDPAARANAEKLLSQNESK